MNILIVDDSHSFRLLLRLYLSKRIKRANIVEYDPQQLGRPGPDYDWAQFDILFLDYQLGLDEDGLDWLENFRHSPGFPPVIMLTGEGNEYVAVKAIKLGAADYINKADISPRRIADMIASVFKSMREPEKDRKREMDSASKIVQNIKGQSKKKQDDVGYKFIKVIGAGAMSKVYLSERISDKLTVALKVLDLAHLCEGETVWRFLQEAELISSLDSPFVAKIYEHGITKDYGYIAMEFFSRGNLRQRMDAPMASETAIIYATHIAYALDQIHSVDVIHRDLKPANIMFRSDDSLALTDFGISKKIDELTDITTIGQILGTPYYMSPEQGEGKVVDARTDLYSLGVLFYELMTGEKPYTAPTVAALIYQHAHREIPRLPPSLARCQNIIDMAMAKNHEDRYQSAKEIIRDLERL